MADDFIDGGAQGLAVAHVVQSRRVQSTFECGLVHDAVDFISRNAGADGRSGKIQNLSPVFAHSFHFENFLAIELGDRVRTVGLLFSSRAAFAVRGVVRAGDDIFGHDTLGGEKTWTKIAGKFKLSGEGVIREGVDAADVVRLFVLSPVFGEAFLTAEEVGF